MELKSWTIGFLCILCSATGLSQPLANAHAHNDYEHERPLLDALRYGFTSVEADVFLIEGKLLVAHSRPIFRDRTLQQLYLSPLDSILKKNDGKVYPGYSGPFYLMIDIKSDGEPTYTALKEALRQYASLFYPSGVSGPVTIFLSGNRPIASVLNDPASPVGLDGRPEDVGKGYSPAVMPVISDTYKKWSDWNGKHTPFPDELKRIRQLSGAVHAEGKKLRLWAIPDNPLAWKELLAAGVDLINTDNLKEFNRFLNSVKK